MALDAQQIVTIALAAISPKGQVSGMLQPLVRSKLQEALNAVGETISNGPDRRLLQKTFSFTIDVPSQSTSLVAGGTSAAEALLIPYDGPKYAPFPACRIGTEDIYFIADRWNAQRQPFRSQRKYYAIETQTLYLYSQAGGLSGSVVVTGNYVPSITQTVDGGGHVTAESINAPTTIQNDIVAALVAICKAALAPMAQPQQQEQAA